MLGFSHPRIPSKEAHGGTCTRIHGACARTFRDDDRSDVRQLDDGAHGLDVRRPADGDADDPGCRVGADKHSSSYHRLFSAARWSLDAMGLAVFALVEPWLGEVVMLERPELFSLER